jgi:hypothetical protein
MQTRVYRSLLVQAGIHLNNGSPIEPDQVEMVYWYAEYPSMPSKFLYEQMQYERDWNSIIKIVTEISNTNEFPMTDDQVRCTFCTYRSYCERGDKVAEESDVETGFTGADINLEQIQEIEF